MTAPLKIGDISLDPNTGRLFDAFLQKHLIMLDEDFYRGLHNRLYEILQSGAEVILHQIGIGYGEVMGKMITEIGGSRIEVYKKFIERGKHQGYGQFNVPLFEALKSTFTGDIAVRLKDSFFALSAGKTGKIECQIVAGIIAGAAPYTLGRKELECVETKCLSKGDDYCEFLLK